MPSSPLTADSSPDFTDISVDLGPQHPASHRVLRLRLQLEGETILAADPQIGFMHRGVEKLFEVRDWRQILVLANRHDWLGSFNNELTAALLIESMVGLEPPERATWLRMSLAELGRIFSHLAALSSFPGEIPGSGLAKWSLQLLRERDALQKLLDAATGSRLHFMANTLGGLRSDVSPEWMQAIRQFLTRLSANIPEWVDAAAQSPQADKLHGRGVISADQIAAYGVTGPIARASGVDHDLRRDAPVMRYADLFPPVPASNTFLPASDARVVVRQAGDAWARVEMLFAQMLVSANLVEICLERAADLAGQPINIALPRQVKFPEMHNYMAGEGPWGHTGFFLVGAGTKTPVRLKMRTASFNNLQIISALLPGTQKADLPYILGSLFLVIGDVDK